MEHCVHSSLSFVTIGSNTETAFGEKIFVLSGTYTENVFDLWYFLIHFITWYSYLY